MVQQESGPMEKRSLHSRPPEDWTEFSSSYDDDCQFNYSTDSDSTCHQPIETWNGPSLVKLHQNLKLFLEKHSDENHDEICDENINDIECIFKENEIWDAVAQVYGNPRQFVWTSSHLGARLPLIVHHDGESDGNVETDLMEEELFDAMDMHRLSRNHNNPVLPSTVAYDEVQTAEEVIEEIEEILQSADEQIEAVENKIQSGTSITLTFGELEDIEDFTPYCVTDSYRDALLLDESDNERSKSLKRMKLIELHDELKALETTVKLLSESLLTELNLRDELLYEKEIRNTFITKILEVQYKQEQFQQGNKPDGGRFKFGRLTKSLSMSNTSDLSTGRFLTTAIPFDNGTALSLENLSVLIRLLDAIKQDSSDVPALITDYILNVLCPAPHTMRLLNF